MQNNYAIASNCLSNFIDLDGLYPFHKLFPTCLETNVNNCMCVIGHVCMRVIVCVCICECVCDCDCVIVCLFPPAISRGNGVHHLKLFVQMRDRRSPFCLAVSRLSCFLFGFFWGLILVFWFFSIYITHCIFGVSSMYSTIYRDSILIMIQKIQIKKCKVSLRMLWIDRNSTPMYNKIQTFVAPFCFLFL